MDNATKKELLSDLKVLEMGTMFANCHFDFVDTRNAVKRLQQDVADIIKKYGPHLETSE